MGLPCFWCLRRAKPTRDHVVPLAMGGKNARSNVVPACFPCNNERGRVTQAVVFAARGRWTLTRKAGWAALHAKWVRLERERLGRSYHDLPDRVVTARGGPA